jgi:hypothetical protein
MSGTPKALLKALDNRDGHRCAWHEGGLCDQQTLVPHHRANRGMGGRKSANVMSNLVWLCSEMNGRIEAQALFASVARGRAIKISSHDNPEHVPIIHAVHGRCLLLDDGSVVTDPLIVF